MNRIHSNFEFEVAFSTFCLLSFNRLTTLFVHFRYKTRA
jgi:hypothetical protein